MFLECWIITITRNMVGNMVVLAFFGHLGASWMRLGTSEAHLGASWGRLGRVLGASGRVLGASWSVLGRCGNKKAIYVQFPWEIWGGVLEGFRPPWALLKKPFIHIGLHINFSSFFVSFTNFRRKLEPWILSLLSRFLRFF